MQGTTSIKITSPLQGISTNERDIVKDLQRTLFLLLLTLFLMPRAFFSKFCGVQLMKSPKKACVIFFNSTYFSFTPNLLSLPVGDRSKLI